MFSRLRALPAAIAITALASLGTLTAAPAFASPAPVSADVSSVVAGNEKPTDQSPAVVNNDTERTAVAEESSDAVTGLILVAGLGVLIASILLVVRSGNRAVNQAPRQHTHL